MADTKIDELKNKIHSALSDPKAPWYGSDVVAWVGDYIIEVEKQRNDLLADLNAECRVSQMLLAENKKLKKEIGDLRAKADELMPTFRFWGDGWVLLTQKAYWESRDKIATIFAENKELKEISTWIKNMLKQYHEDEFWNGRPADVVDCIEQVLKGK